MMYILKISILIFLLGIVCDAKKSKIITLTSKNWDQTLKGEWMIKFYAPWCPACKAMEEDYKKFADWSDDLNVRVAEVNMNEEPGLSGRFIVTALPTIYHAKDGEFRRYTGARDTNSLHRFIEDGIWGGVEPVGWYRHPQSIPMMLMSGLFQTSVIMKNFHEILTETYGFSTNMSYVIFAVVTVVAGLVLGLLLVFIIDCISPPKRHDKPEIEMTTPITEKEEKEEREGEEDEKESIDSGSSEEDTEDEKSQASSAEEEEEADVVRRSSQSSSRTSQDWEQVQGEEVQESQLNIEKQLQDELEEGQGELRQRITQKKQEEAKDED